MVWRRRRLALQQEACRLSPHVFGLSAASLMSLVIIFCLFFAESWIICVYALLLDDSCAVGLQSVFQIRWIMNKPRQQKSHVLYVPCLPSSVPAFSWRVNHWGGDRWAGDSLWWCTKFPSSNCFILYLFIFFSELLYQFLSRLISAVSPKLAVRNPASLSLRLSLSATRQTCVKSADQSVRANTTLLLQYTQQACSPSGKQSH